MEYKKPQYTVANEGVALRPLFINLNKYAEGNTAFKRELVTQIVKGLREFQQVLHEAISQRDHARFSKICHKSKVILSMLNDEALLTVIHEIERDIITCKTGTEVFVRRVLFDTLCGAVVISLEAELKNS